MSDVTWYAILAGMIAFLALLIYFYRKLP